MGAGNFLPRRAIVGVVGGAPGGCGRWYEGVYGLKSGLRIVDLGDGFGDEGGERACAVTVEARARNGKG